MKTYRVVIDIKASNLDKWKLRYVDRLFFVAAKEDSGAEVIEVRDMDAEIVKNAKEQGE